MHFDCSHTPEYGHFIVWTRSLEPTKAMLLDDLYYYHCYHHACCIMLEIGCGHMHVPDELGTAALPLLVSHVSPALASALTDL